MSRLSLVPGALAALALLSACPTPPANNDGGDKTTDSGTPGDDSGTPGDDSGTPGDDSGTPGDDSGTPGDDSGTPGGDSGIPGGDSGVPGDGGMLTGTSAQIEAVRTATPTDAGVLNLPVESATVTFVRDLVGSDDAAVFVQAEATGPALVVVVDPTTLAPEPVVGDTVSFTVDNVTELSNGVVAASAISGYTRDATGGDVEPLRQDISAATDLVSNLDAYEAELIHVEGSVVTELASAGTAHKAVQIDTAGVSGDTNLRLRVPDAVVDALNPDDLAPGCTFTVDGVMWRFFAAAQATTYDAGALSVGSCPAPQLLSAQATSATGVRLNFSRALDPNTVDATDFSINGLTVVAATVAGRTVTLTTSAQTPSQSYTVTAAGDAADARGSAVDANANTATFDGYACDGTALGTLIISEVVDHAVTTNARFVEIYNATDADVDLTGWELRRYANANPMPGTIALSGTLGACGTYVVANSQAAFEGAFPGVTADQYSGTISGNGDDTYEIHNGTATVDIYGEAGVDGTGQAWEYTDSVARRNDLVISGSSTWNQSEWTITNGAATASPRIR